MMNCTL